MGIISFVSRLQPFMGIGLWVGAALGPGTAALGQAPKPAAPVAPLEKPVAPPAAPAVRVEQLPGRRLMPDDPAIRTPRDFDPPTTNVPQTPTARLGKGAFAVAGQARWAPIRKLDLAPGQSHEVSVPVREPALLLARANWVGSPGPIRMVVTSGGATLATGKTYPVPPDRGTVTARADLTKPGVAKVSVANDGKVPVKVQVVVGTLPHSLRR